jgi:nitric oxide reductase NorE protein
VRSATAAVVQAEDTVAERLPGDASMWFFVVGEIWIFTCYFACYLSDRREHSELFLREQQRLSQALGIANTVLLLTSSLFVALAVKAARAGIRASAARFIAVGGACGLGFVVIKAVFEWYPKLDAGLTISSNEFWTYYYMLTGLHLFHVMLGLGLLAFIWRELRATSVLRPALVETGATYWHMVDLIWIILVAVLYLMR